MTRILDTTGKNGRRLTVDRLDANHVGPSTDGKGYSYLTDDSLATKLFRTEADALRYAATL